MRPLRVPKCLGILQRCPLCIDMVRKRTQRFQGRTLTFELANNPPFPSQLSKHTIIKGDKLVITSKILNFLILISQSTRWIKVPCPFHLPYPLIAALEAAKATFLSKQVARLLAEAYERQEEYPNNPGRSHRVINDSHPLMLHAHLRRIRFSKRTGHKTAFPWQHLE